GDSFAEMNRARRTGRRELDDPPGVAGGTVGIEPPPPACLEPLGAIDVGYGNHDDFEFQIDGRGRRGAGRASFFRAGVRTGHDVLLRSRLSMRVDSGSRRARG